MPDRPTYARDLFKPKPVRITTEQRRADNRFYASARWKKLRALQLAKQPLCEECLAHGQTMLAEHVHHKIPRKQGPGLALDQANLASICQACHNQQEIR